jgi:hypothetical protein
MHLNWSESWTRDIIDEATEILALCQARLTSLPYNQRERSAQVLATVQQQLNIDHERIRRGPHIWGTQLSNVAIRIIRRKSMDDEAERTVARQLANFCGIVYNYRRHRKAEDYENLFRDSLEVFLSATLPDMVSTVIAADTLEQLREWVKQFYERVPKDFSFKINDIVLNAYEMQRSKLDTEPTHGLMLKFIEDNRDLISLPVSESSEWKRKRWEELYRNHLGEPPQIEAGVITSELRARLKHAVDSNDPFAVRDVLAPLETSLTQAVQKILDASFELREPSSVVRDYSRKASADFEAARRQVRSNSKKATGSFEEVWRKQTQNLFAQEWYAYALAKLEGAWLRARDLFGQVRSAGKADQVTDWNLAYCEVKLQDQQSAFDILRHRVESGQNFEDVLEPTLALALQLGEKRFLAEQLDWLPLEEAVVLAYVFAADTGALAEQLEERLSAIAVIASEAKRFDPPHPAETIDNQDLSDLAFGFIRRGMLRGGINWYRRRVGFREHRFFYLNWKQLGDLCLRGRCYDEAEHAYEMMLTYTDRPTTPVDVKQRALDGVLNILVESERTVAAGKLLDRFAAFLPPDEVKRWRQHFYVGQKEKPATTPTNQFVPLKEEGDNAADQFPSPANGDTRSRLMQLMARLFKVRRLDDLEGDCDCLKEAATSLYQLWPAYSRKLVDRLKNNIDLLQKFRSSSDSSERQQIGAMLRENVAEINAELKTIIEPTLKQQAESLVLILARLAADASYQTGATRAIVIDWRLTDYLPNRAPSPLNPGLPATALLLRIANEGAEQVSCAEVYLQSESGKISVQGNPQQIKEPLEAGATAIVRFPLSYESLEGQETFVAYGRFGAGGVVNLQTPLTRFEIAGKSFEDLVGGNEIRDHFFVGVGIPEGRRDIFQGREREQRRIANSLRGAVQPEVLFLNGPRRVGKTSILNSLRWALPECGLSEVIPVTVPEGIPQTSAAYLWGIAMEVATVVGRHLGVEGYLHVPPLDQFGPEPTLAFRRFCTIAQERLAPRRILLMIDETQRLADAVKQRRIDSNVLGLFSTLMSTNSGVMFIFTASVLFGDVKALSPHPLWGRVVPFATGFLGADAVTRVLEAGVTNYPVKFTPEALNRVWQVTEGHPWVVQGIGKRVMSEVLNPQQRLVVSPADVDQAVAFIETSENQYTDYWWNVRPEEGGFIDETDWDIASFILLQQKRQGLGVPRGTLFEQMRQQNRPVSNGRLRKLMEMQTLVQEVRGDQDFIRIKGLFLENWLSDQLSTRSMVSGAGTQVNQVALFVDHENVAVSLERFVEQLSANQKATAGGPFQDRALLARRLSQNAERFGKITTRVVVANWPLFSEDMQGYAQSMFGFDHPLGGKNTSDEKLKQLIRDTLEKEPDVNTYVLATGDADFRDTIQTLLKRNKRVVVWGFRARGAVKSNISNVFRDMETWQNLTIEYLDDILPKDSGSTLRSQSA